MRRNQVQGHLKQRLSRRGTAVRVVPENTVHRGHDLAPISGGSPVPSSPLFVNECRRPQPGSRCMRLCQIDAVIRESWLSRQCDSRGYAPARARGERCLPTHVKRDVPGANQAGHIPLRRIPYPRPDNEQFAGTARAAAWTIGGHRRRCLRVSGIVRCQRWAGWHAGQRDRS